jgi:hypothetical protein
LILEEALTPASARINPILSVATTDAVESEMPACEDWTALNVNNILLRIVAIISGYIFVGPKLCRDPVYLDLSINYTVDAMMTLKEVRETPEWLRPIAIYFMTYYRRYRGYRTRVQKFLDPIIKARKADMANPPPGYEAPDDLLQWTINKAPRFDEMKSDTDIAQMQLRISFAAIHTTTATTTSM